MVVDTCIPYSIISSGVRNTTSSFIYRKSKEKMKICTSYSVRLAAQPVRLQDTLDRYRGAVDFFIHIVDVEWPLFSECNGRLDAMRLAERLCISTKTHPDIRYDFSLAFYKFPSYMRRAAIAETYGLVSSWRSNLAAWRAADPTSRGKRPGAPTGFAPFFDVRHASPPAALRP